MVLAQVVLTYKYTLTVKRNGNHHRHEGDEDLVTPKPGCAQQLFERKAGAVPCDATIVDVEQDGAGEEVSAVVGVVGKVIKRVRC